MRYHPTRHGALAAALRAIGREVDPDRLIDAAREAGLALPVEASAGVQSATSGHQRVGGHSLAYAIPDARLSELADIVDRLMRGKAA